MLYIYLLIHNGVSYLGASVTIFLRWCFGIISNTVSIDRLTLDVIASNSPNPPEWQKRKYSRPALVNLPRDLFTSALPTASSSDPVSLSISGSVGSASISGEGTASYVKLPATVTQTTGLGLEVKNFIVNAAPLSKGTLHVTNQAIQGAPSTEGNYPRLTVHNDDIARGLSVKTSGGFTSGIYPRELRLVFGLDLKQQIRNLSGKLSL